MAQARAIMDLTMGAGTWATVALMQGLPYFGVALTDTRDHEVMGHLKGEAGSAQFFSELESAQGAYGAFEKCVLQRSGQVLLMQTTPTSVLYVKSLADATKGKVKAAGRGAEKKRKKETEGKTQDKTITNETKPASSDSNSEPSSPAQ